MTAEFPCDMHKGFSETGIIQLGPSCFLLKISEHGPQKKSVWSYFDVISKPAG